MTEAIDLLPLGDEVRATLLGQTSGPLGLTAQLIRASERGAWDTVTHASIQLHLTQREVARLYYEALGWVRSFF